MDPPRCRRLEFLCSIFFRPGLCRGRCATESGRRHDAHASHSFRAPSPHAAPPCAGDTAGLPSQESSREISTARLRTRRRASTCRLSTSSSPTSLRGDLILGWASCLDAFSTYPFRARIPCNAPGGTTGTPVARPARSSRTSAGSPQISNAHNR